MDHAVRGVIELRCEGIQQSIQHLDQLGGHVLRILKHHQLAVLSRSVQNTLIEHSSSVNAAHQRGEIRFTRNVENAMVLVVDLPQQFIHHPRLATSLRTMQHRRLSKAQTLQKLARLLRTTAQSSQLREGLILFHHLQQVCIQLKIRTVLEEQQHVSHSLVLKHVLFAVLQETLNHLLFIRQDPLLFFHLHGVLHVLLLLVANVHFQETVAESGRERQQSLLGGCGHDTEVRPHLVIGLLTVLIKPNHMPSSIRGTQLEDGVESFDHVRLHRFHGLKNAHASILNRVQQRRGLEDGKHPPVLLLQRVAADDVLRGGGRAAVNDAGELLFQNGMAVLAGVVLRLANE